MKTCILTFMFAIVLFDHSRDLCGAIMTWWFFWEVIKYLMKRHHRKIPNWVKNVSLNTENND